MRRYRRMFSLRLIKFSRRLRRVLGLFIAVIVGLIVVLLVNASRLKTRQFEPRQPANKSQVINTNELADVLADFLAVPSYSFTDRSLFDREAFVELHAILERRFPEAHRTLQRQRINELSLLYLWQGTDASQDPILLMSHMDVVPVVRDSLQQWKHPPHDGVITEDMRLENGERAIECRVVHATSASQTSSTESAAFKTLQRTIHQVFPETLVAAGLTSVTTDSRWYFPIADDVYRFIPMRFQNADVERIHGVNERIGVENMAEIVRFYAQLIRNFG